MNIRVLITSPSLDVNTNVSGIAALVRPLVDTFPDVYLHLCVGTPDGRKSALNRVFYLTKAIAGLVGFAFSAGDKRCHLNTAADTPSLLRDVVLLNIARVVGLKVVVHFHGGKWITTPACPWFAQVLVRSLCNGGQACVVLGAEEAAILRDRFGVSRAVKVLPNYVSPEFVCEPREFVKQPLTLLFLGRLVESKSVDQLANLLRQVLKRVPAARLVVCGDGPLRGRLLNDLAVLPDNSWCYKGVVSGAEKLDALRQADVFILPSITGEGMPIAMLEAMATSAIPVVTWLGAIPSVVTQARNGFIAQPGDLDEFASCVVLALTTPNREHIRRAAYETSLDFSLNVYRDRLDVIYDAH